MQIVIGNIELFKNFFDVIYDMASESVELQLFPDRMVCAVLDRGRTRFFHVEYDRSFFDVYQVDDVESITVYVDDFHKLLKSCNRKDVLYLEVNDPYLVTKIMSENGSTRVFEFVLPSDFIDSPNPPKLDLPVSVECDVGDLKQSSKDISLIGSDLFRLVTGEDNLTLMTSDDIPTKYANVIDVEYEKNDVGSSANFNVDYINQMLKFSKINKNVELNFGSDLPLFYTFRDEFLGVVVNGMIAPRISEEE